MKELEAQVALLGDVKHNLSLAESKLKEIALVSDLTTLSVTCTDDSPSKLSISRNWHFVSHSVICRKWAPPFSITILHLSLRSESGHERE